MEPAVSEEMDEAREPRMPAADDDGRLAVTAHSLLGDIAAVRTAIELAHERDGENTSDLLALAMRRLDNMTAFCRELVRGESPLLRSGIDLTTHPSFVPLTGGTVVELYSAFNSAWAPGFEIVDSVPGGYRVRRVSDGAVLPGHTSRADLRVMVDRTSL
jgi:hypothetical protein